jgi:NAD(P)-dependent dehydrogenase (short-subunit alcohol dehydrogenase family)
MPAWTIAQIPPQPGRTAVVTGATSGLGYETALALAGSGARVLLASRNEVKAAEVLARIRRIHPRALVAFEALDLSNLASVAACAARIAQAAPSLDLLVNNAGVMAIPTRHMTADGFEMQFAANYLGHFALTLHLLPQLLAASAPRVVALSSIVHRAGRLRFNDLNGENGYRGWSAYAQSKIAMLMFSLELDRRARRQGWHLMSNAAHPGYAVTELQSAGPRMGRRDAPRFFERLMKLAEPFVAQSAEAGARPTLYAATAPDAEGGVLYGPDGFYELKGDVKKAKIATRALDQADWLRLWNVSEQITGVRMSARQGPRSVPTRPGRGQGRLTVLRQSSE